MSRFSQSSDQTGAPNLRNRLIILAFGLIVLGFLIAIDRSNWFELRPVSTASAAMANASATEVAKTGDGA